MSDIYKNKKYIQLREIAPNAKFSVLICSDLNCTNHYEVFTTIHERDKIDTDWLLHLSCSVCKNTWSICTLCNKLKVKMITNCMISLHRSTYHGKTKKRIKKDSEHTTINYKRQKGEGNIDDVTGAITEYKNNCDDNVNMYIASSQLEYDITIGSSVDDQQTVEIINDGNIINDKNIMIDNKFNDDNDKNFTDNNIMSMYNKLKEEEEAFKIASIVSFFFNLRYNKHKSLTFTLL